MTGPEGGYSNGHDGYRESLDSGLKAARLPPLRGLTRQQLHVAVNVEPATLIASKT